MKKLATSSRQVGSCSRAEVRLAARNSCRLLLVRRAGTALPLAGRARPHRCGGRVQQRADAQRGESRQDGWENRTETFFPTNQWQWQWPDRWITTKSLFVSWTLLWALCRERPSANGLLGVFWASPWLMTFFRFPVVYVQWYRDPQWYRKSKYTLKTEIIFREV